MSDSDSSDEFSRLRKDNEFLKDQIARLQSELHSYHQSVGLLGLAHEVEIDVPEWMSSSEIVSPIFTAYDARILECGRLMEQQGKHLDELTERSQQLLTENERLRQNVSQGLIQKRQHETNSEKDGPTVVSSSSDSNDSRVKSLEAENELISQQSELLSKELDSSNEAIRIRNKQISQLEARVGQLSSEKRASEERLLQKVEEANAFKERSEKLNSDIQKGNLLRSDLSAKLEDLTTERNDFENEAETLSANVAVLAARVQDLQAKLSSKTREADVMSDQNRKNERELGFTKKDAQNMAKIISGLESKLDEITKRESKATRDAMEYRTKLDDTLLDRDKIEASCNTLRAQLDNLIEQRKADAERTAKEQGDLFGALKAKQASEIASKERVIHDLSLSNAKLKSTSESSLRERAGVEEKYSKLMETLKVERAQVEETCHKLTQRIVEAESQGTSHTKVIQNLETKVHETQELLQEANESLADARSGFAREQERIEKELSESDRALRSLETEAKKRKRETTRFEKSREEDEALHSETLAKKDAEIAQLCARLKEQLAKHDQIISGKNVLYQLQEEKLSSERDVCHRLMARNKDLNSHINILSAEKLELNNIASENEDRVEQLTLSLQEAECKIADMGKELSESLREQQDRIRREQSIRADLREAQMQLGLIKGQV